LNNFRRAFKMALRTRLFTAVLLAVIAIAASPGVARADFIQVISQTYHIDVASGSPAFAPGNDYSFDQTSSSPLFLNHSVSFPPPGGAGGLQFINRADGAITPNSAFVRATNLTFDLGDIGPVFGSHSSAAITFQPLESQILIRPEPVEPSDTTGFASIYDETTATAVLQFTVFHGFVQDPFIWLPLDTTHIYTITARADGLASFTHGGRLTIQAVPEVESVLAFLMVGLLGILAIRFRPARP